MLDAMRFLMMAVCLVACGSPSKRPTTISGGNVVTSLPDGPHRMPQTTADVTVVVTGKAIVFNGVPVSANPTVADMKAIFGEPDRVWDTGAANKIHTWDKLGLLVYEPYKNKVPDGRCISATFAYKPVGQTFSPATLFGGTIKLDGKTVDAKAGLAPVLTWPGASQPYAGSSVLFDRGDFHVFTLEEKKAGLDLVELSFWQNKSADEDKPRPVPRVVDGGEDDSCKNGDPQHCSNRALAYQTGVAGRRNLERAFELVKIACAGGDVFGCLMLGNMYDAGSGTAANKPEAKVSWKRACTLGYKPACSF